MVNHGRRVERLKGGLRASKIKMFGTMMTSSLPRIILPTPCLVSGLHSRHCNMPSLHSSLHHSMLQAPWIKSVRSTLRAERNMEEDRDRIY